MPIAIPDERLMRALREELDRQPDRHGQHVREILKRSCDEYDGSNLAAAKVANAEREARTFLVRAIRRRFEKPASYYAVAETQQRIKRTWQTVNLACDADE